MATLDVCLLWHMHQPCYENRATKETILPWVRLHATKAYLDMAEALARAPEGVSATVNFVPVLLQQLEQYGRGEVKDTFLALSEKPADALSPPEIRFVLRYFFMANWANMVRPHERYWSLLVKRGMDAGSLDLDTAVKRFTPEELRDLQVWFNLSWFGWAAKAKLPVLSEMTKKGRDFSESDKRVVLDAQLECMRMIVPEWKKLADAGRAEMTATPFYHPILPLLINTRHAQRAMPEIALPEDFVAPEDAAAQVERAAAWHEKTWGRRPRGMWPAEGSVSPEVVPVFRKAGVSWIASDEDVLFRSLGRRDRETDLYRPWRAQHAGEEISIFFRDRVLSDLVGFTYSKMAAKDAADDFLARVKSVASGARGETPVASVILDGENPWEWYADGGEGFLARLYEGLAKTAGVRGTTFSRHLESRGTRAPDPLPSLHSGSWINSNYRIWIGHSEDNAGWNLVRKAREEVRRQITNVHPPAEKIEAAMDNLYRAEGSDWFWWFGDDFSSDNDAEFDLLFRTHLLNAYRAVDLEPPPILGVPISKSGEGIAAQPPRCFISPRITGNAESYFEWKGAGYYSVGKSEGTMHKGTAYLSGIHYGFDLDNLYFRLDPVLKVVEKNPVPLTIVLTLSVGAPGKEPVEFRAQFPFRAGIAGYELKGPQGGENVEGLAYDRVVELKVPVKALGAPPGGWIDFRVALLAGEVEVDRYPRNTTVRVPVPTEDFERENWWV